jgi:hypothetical protein
MQQTYRGLIFTNHALERMRDRGLSQDMAYEAFSHADSSTAGKVQGTIEHVKKIDSYRVTMIAKENERREWIVISAWIDPPMPGSIDIKKRENYQRYQKASFLGKLLLTLKKQIGL